MTPEEIHRRRVATFRDLASQEFSAARLLAATNREQAIYLLQQTVEKLVRGILEIEKVAIGPSHNIAHLVSFITKHNDLKSRFSDFDELSPAATRYRYPGPGGELRTVTAANLARLIAKVERLQSDVDGVLSAYVEGGRAPFTNSNKL